MENINKKRKIDYEKLIDVVGLVNVTGKLVINRFMMENACLLPYPRHAKKCKKRCPAYGKRIDCPPKTRIVSDVFDLTRPHYFMIIKFDLGQYVKEMREIHDDWSYDQLKNLLYWQKNVNRILKEEIFKVLDDQLNRIVTYKPEGLGVNVIVTLRRYLNIPIKRIPTKYLYKVALVGYPKYCKDCPKMSNDGEKNYCGIYEWVDVDEESECCVHISSCLEE